MRWLILLVVAFAVVASAATINITYYLDANPWGPGFDQAHVDAILDYLHSGSGSGVDPTTGPLNFADLTVTDYASWRGTVIPDPTDDSPWGTSLFAGVQIIADGEETFAPEDVGVRQRSFNNATADVYWDVWGHWFLTDADLAWMRGYMLDGLGNLVPVNPGYNTQVRELVYVGPSGAFDASLLDLSHDQAGLNQAIAWYQAAYGVHSVTTCYDLGEDSNCETIDITPEPVSMILAGAGLLGLGLLRRRRA